jgi:nitrate/TMAO reductase-like tetraheme cytochrome c subunit
VHAEPLSLITLAAAAAAAVILVRYLVLAPRLDLRVKLLLFLGLGVLPAISAGASTVAGMEATTHRSFCGSCHVMSAHFDDATDPSSQSLAARHSRNPFFGDRSCYVCHADYGMYGYVLTKAGGMRHVYLYLTEYRKMPIEEAKRSIRIRQPVPNANCMYCHTTTAPRWLAVGDHASSLEAVRSGTVGCASAGCHGYAHPMTKLPDEAQPR